MSKALLDAACEVIRKHEADIVKSDDCGGFDSQDILEVMAKIRALAPPGPVAASRVVCAAGHCLQHVSRQNESFAMVYLTESEADSAVIKLDHGAEPFPCGPHRIQSLGIIEGAS